MFKLQELPYSYDALSPYMSAETLEFHHDKHHKAYIDKVNSLVKEDSKLEGKSLEELIVLSKNDPSLKVLFNNAGQILNHNLFWPSMMKNGGKITPVLEKKIIEDFGSVDAFKQEFKTKGETLFGSGWVWLTMVDGKLTIMQYTNAGNPVMDGRAPLLGCDVWEHSYYIDYRNKRGEYLETFLNSMVNWEFVEEQFTKA